MAPTRDSSNSAKGGSHYQPSLGIMLVILILFVGTTFVALRSHSPVHATTPTTPSTTVHHSTKTTTTTTKTTTGTVPKSQVSVQVANGTTTSGLAGTFTTKLQLLGWNTLPRLNGPAETATVIYYHPGFLWAAQEIASELPVAATAAKPIGTATPVPGATGDDIVVILGPDVAG